MKGMSDAIGIKNGTVCFFELKAPKGNLTKEQEEFIFEWTAHGGNAFVIRSLEDAQKVVERVNLLSRLKENSCPLPVNKHSPQAPPSA